jgi:protein-S-isoprenylcysteine O-methyltransferase Ste14
MATNDDTSGVRVFPPLIYLVAIAAGLLVQRALRFPLAGWPAGVRILGWVLIAIGLGAAIWAVAVFRLAGTTPNPTRPTTAFVVRGPYRFTRNPMYVGLTAVSMGVGLVTESPWVIVMAFVAALVTQRMVIDREESYLDRRFGADYRAYKARVRRWV